MPSPLSPTPSSQLLLSLSHLFLLPREAPITFPHKVVKLQSAIKGRCSDGGPAQKHPWNKALIKGGSEQQPGACSAGEAQSRIRYRQNPGEKKICQEGEGRCEERERRGSGLWSNCGNSGRNWGGAGAAERRTTTGRSWQKARSRRTVLILAKCPREHRAQGHRRPHSSRT